MFNSATHIYTVHHYTCSRMDFIQVSSSMCVTQRHYMHFNITFYANLCFAFDTVLRVQMKYTVLDYQLFFKQIWIKILLIFLKWIFYVRSRFLFLFQIYKVIKPPHSPSFIYNY